MTRGKGDTHAQIFRKIGARVILSFKLSVIFLFFFKLFVYIGRSSEYLRPGQSSQCVPRFAAFPELPRIPSAPAVLIWSLGRQKVIAPCNVAIGKRWTAGLVLRVSPSAP